MFILAWGVVWFQWFCPGYSVTVITYKLKIANVPFSGDTKCCLYLVTCSVAVHRKKEGCGNHWGKMEGRTAVNLIVCEGQKSNSLAISKFCKRQLSPSPLLFKPESGSIERPV